VGVILTEEQVAEIEARALPSRSASYAPEAVCDTDVPALIASHRALAAEVERLRADNARQADLLAHATRFGYAGRTTYAAVRCPLPHAARPYWMTQAVGAADMLHDTLEEAIARARELAGEEGAPT
jgi:hypothetical protein